MSLINIDLTDAERKLVEAIQEQILPEFKNDVIRDIVPALSKALEGLHFEVRLTVDVTRKMPDIYGPPAPSQP